MIVEKFNTNATKRYKSITEMGVGTLYFSPLKMPVKCGQELFNNLLLHIKAWDLKEFCLKVLESSLSALPYLQTPL